MGLLIMDGQRRFDMSLDTWRASKLIELGQHRGFVPPPTSEVADVPPIPMCISHGKMSVSCPDCGGSEYVWKGRPIMMCASCWNGAVGFLWRPVAVPDDLTLICSILSRRPIVQTQNWYSGETVDDLQAENADHEVA